MNAFGGVVRRLMTGALVEIWQAASAKGFRVDGADGLGGDLACAAARLGEAGVGPGAVVLHQAPQHRDGLILFWAAMARGAVFVPIDPSWPEPLLRQAAGGLDPRMIAASGERLEVLKRVFPNARPIEIGGDATWSGAHPPAVLADMPEAAPGAYLFTSGSTGTPKAVVLSRGALATSARLAAETFGWDRREVLINLAEPHTMSGLRNAFIAAPAAGMDWRPQPPAERFDVFALAERLEETGCQRLVAAPSLLRLFALMGSRIEPSALAKLKAVYCTGATLAGQDAAKFHDRFGVPVIDYYGLTETAGLCLSQEVEGWAPGQGSLGRPVGCEVRLMSEGREAEEGELQIRSPQLMSGYLGDPEATAARFDGEWLRTGDLVRRRPDGAYELVGRLDAFIKTAAAERVHPREIEDALTAHAAVAEAAVLGLAEGGGPERICALVVTHAGAPVPADLADQLAAYVAERLGAARRPNRVRIVERLPRSAAGKLIRADLERLLA